MAEKFALFFEGYGLPRELIVFFVSLMPILELRGGLIAAKLLNVPFKVAFPICFAGNVIPIPFILLFIRQIFQFLRDKKGFSKLIEKLEIRAMRKSEKVKRGSELGLLLFVGIPIPGTGAWMGALIAALLDMRIKRSFPIILIGILMAGAIMSILTYFFPELFGF